MKTRIITSSSRDGACRIVDGTRRARGVLLGTGVKSGGLRWEESEEEGVDAVEEEGARRREEEEGFEYYGKLEKLSCRDAWIDW